MSPVKNVSQSLYKFSSVGQSKHLDNHSKLWVLSRNLQEKFLRFKEELKEALRECSYYPCLGEDHACGYFNLEECPFYWAFENGLIGGDFL